jgi:response regulator NasT
MHSDKPLRIMLVDDDAERASSLEESLRVLGFEVLSIVASTSALLFQIEQNRPDVVLIDLKFPGRDILESLTLVNHHNPTAMVMFSQADDPEYIRQAFQAGVNTYLTEGLEAAKVKPIIDVALAQFNSFQTLRDELKLAKSQLQDEKTLGQAKAMLMQQKKLDENEAHLMLKRLAMNNNLNLVEVAKTVVATLSLVEKDTPE